MGNHQIRDKHGEIDDHDMNQNPNQNPNQRIRSMRNQYESTNTCNTNHQQSINLTLRSRFHNLNHDLLGLIILYSTFKEFCIKKRVNQLFHYVSESHQILSKLSSVLCISSLLPINCNIYYNGFYYII